ncbi:ABC transporter substrate-binding protein [Pseudonocardia acaciae]|uniref:ABC transporter substrate-binding protein n=1 Tax=Pseudonocardia acaciae TaxID=551276 RepID=UPI00048B6AF8|nr:ABC transporter substrate-binding protein [Pseudonocardia acaciae]
MTRRLVVAVVAALLLAGCGAGGRPSGGGGASSDVGVTPTAVKIGAHYPLTGVAAPGYSEIPVGAKAYFDFVNAAGGVNGRKIDYIYKDDGYIPTNTTQVVNELVLKDQVFAMLGGLGTPTHGAVLDFLNGEGVPDVFVSSGSLLWNQPKRNPMTFGWQPDYEVEAKILSQYVAQTFPTAKVGLFLQNDDLGRDAEAGARRYLDRQIVSAVRYTPGNTDIAPQVAELQAAGADFVIGFNVPSYTALSQLAALRLNYKPKWAYSSIGSDPPLVGGLLARLSQGQVSGSTMLDGVLTTQYLHAPYDANSPWVQLWRKVWAAHGSGGELSSFKIYGMAQAYSFVQVLLAAGPNPTRKGLVAALEKIGTGLRGPALAPYRFTPDSHAGMSGTMVTRIRGTAADPITPVRVTDNGAAPITDLAQQPTAPPPNGVPDQKPAE